MRSLNLDPRPQAFFLRLFLDSGKWIVLTLWFSHFSAWCLSLRFPFIGLLEKDAELYLLYNLNQMNDFYKIWFWRPVFGSHSELIYFMIFGIFAETTSCCLVACEMVLCDGNLPYLYSITWRGFSDESNRYYLVAFRFLLDVSAFELSTKARVPGWRAGANQGR